MEAEWPFGDPSSIAAFTTQGVLKGKHAILLVTHDADDDAWQFHDGGTVCPDEAMVVKLSTMFAHDPTLYELADLPQGWAAWRDSLHEPWQRAPLRIVDDGEEEICPCCGIRHLPESPDPKPDLDDDGWFLESGVARHVRSPETFEIPCEAARTSLMPGDIAKLLFHLRTPNGATRCERMWVRVTEAGATGYLGLLDNDPLTPGVLEAGDLIPFRQEHVISIWRE